MALGGLGVAAGLACGRDAKPNAPGPEEPYNVLVIVSDEHNAGVMGCAGDPIIQTPNLDRLAAGGVRLSRAYAASPVCAPARQSLLTGLWPNEHGQWGNNAIFDERVPTLAPIFQAAGYHTAFIGKSHANNPGQTFGFDLWQGRDTALWKGTGLALQANIHNAPWRDDKEPFKAIPDRRLRGRPLKSEDNRDGGTWLDLTTRFLRSAPKQPWLLYSSFAAPHHPWEIPEPYYWMYDPSKLVMPEDLADPLTDSLVARSIRQENKWNRMDEAAHRLCRARYYGAVSYADSLVGRLLGVLDELDLTRRTLVVYLSDHGDMASAKGMWLKSVMFDPAVRVPAIFRMPGQLAAGTTVDGLWSGTDLSSTLAGLVGAGAHVPKTLSGRDRSPMLKGKPGYSPEYTFSVLTPQPKGEWPGQLMVRSSRFKLIHYPPGKHTDRQEYVEFYDLEQDPLEQKNLSKTASFQRELRDHLSAGREFLAEQDYCPYPVRRVQDMPEDDETVMERDSG